MNWRSTCVWLLATASVPAQAVVSRVSVDSSGAEGDTHSGRWWRPAVSADGRYVAFDSDATNLVPSDTNGFPDLFVHDRLTGATVRVSIDSSGAQANGISFAPSLSSDGRFVAFQSPASNLVANDTNAHDDVFVHDRDPDGNGVFDEGNGVTTLESIDSNGSQGSDNSGFPSISADGSIVAFSSLASDLIPGDTNDASDVFVRDRTAGATELVSVNSKGVQGKNGSKSAVISADGSTVAFISSAKNLVFDTNNGDDVFVRDRVLGVTTRVSVDSSGAESNGHCFDCAISADGMTVAFKSGADNLVPNDTNRAYDCFVHDRATGATTRVSVDSAGVQGDKESLYPTLSSDGRIVAFVSLADNLVANDANATDDLFVHDRATGVTTVMTTNCMGVAADDFSYWSAISGDGNVVVFGSVATDLVSGDGNGSWDVFVRDRAADGFASWNNYGAGFPGTLGVPALTASAAPAFGADFDLAIGNSLGAPTPGVLLIGLDSDSIGTSAGGTILVDVALIVPILVDAGGSSIPETVPYDERLCSQSIDLQVLELDAGAAHGISFTPGLELVIGL